MELKQKKKTNQRERERERGKQQSRFFVVCFCHCSSVRHCRVDVVCFFSLKDRVIVLPKIHKNVVECESECV